MQASLDYLEVKWTQLLARNRGNYSESDYDDSEYESEDILDVEDDSHNSYTTEGVSPKSNASVSNNMETAEYSRDSEQTKDVLAIDTLPSMLIQGQ